MVLSACATSGSSQFGLPSSTAESYAASIIQAETRLSDICLPTVFNDVSFQDAVAAAGLRGGTNPFNERRAIFPETSYTSAETPRLHVFHTVAGTNHVCTIFALDGDPDQVLDRWQSTLRAEQDRRGLSGDPVEFPGFEALEDGRARYMRIGEGVLLTLSSDAQTARVVADRPNAYRVLRPATGVLLTISGPAD